MNNKFSQKIVFIAIFCIAFFSISKNLFAENLQVSVKVPAKATDFQITTANLTAGSPFSQNSNLEYQITYGSYLEYATQVIIEADWSQGTLNGYPVPSVDILDYVVGSASKAYNNTSAVVDTVNRKITWTISSFPALTTNKTVTFKLKTNDSYTGSSTVSFNITGILTNEDAILSNQAANQEYLFAYPSPTPTPTSTPTPTAAPTPTPTPGPTATPVPGATSTPTPKPTTKPTQTPAPTSTPVPTPAPIVLKTVNVSTVTDENATIYVNTNKQSKFKILYGTSPTALNQTITDSSLDYEHAINLPDLLPDTKYYYKIVTTDVKNTTTASDVFSVKTATVSDAPIIAKDTLTISSGNSILVSQTSQSQDASAKEQQKTLVIPDKTVYNFKFSLAKIKSVKQIKIVVRKKKSILSENPNKTVLGAATTNDENQNQQNLFAEDIAVTQGNNEVNTKEVQLTEIQPGVFSGRLASNLPPGDYELIAVVTDNDGNIIETTLSQLKVINRFTVLSKTTNQPIEAVRVYLYIYNAKTNKYDKVLPDIIAVTNPSFTDSHGELSIVLPQGKYRAGVADINYKDKTVDFTIGTGKDDSFPIVYLENQPFNIAATLRYYGRSIRDVYFYYTLQYFSILSKSLRFYNLINAISLTLFVIVTFLAFRFRTHIPMRSIFSYLIYHIRKMTNNNVSSFYLEGTVLDGETKKPISKVNTYLIDGKTHQAIKQTSTNTNGHFFFELDNLENYEILAVKNGYEITPFIETARETYNKLPVNILLKKSESQANFIVTILLRLIEIIMGYFFEYLLIFSFLFELLSIPYFGLQKTTPFILISGFNFFLWILHLRQKGQIHRVI